MATCRVGAMLGNNQHDRPLPPWMTMPTGMHVKELTRVAHLDGVWGELCTGNCEHVLHCRPARCSSSQNLEQSKRRVQLFYCAPSMKQKSFAHCALADTWPASVPVPCQPALLQLYTPGERAQTWACLHRHFDAAAQGSERHADREAASEDRGRRYVVHASPTYPPSNQVRRTKITHGSLC